MITVTTADSKYSRQTVLGGPFGGTGVGGVFELPLRLKSFERENELASGELVVTFSVVKLLAIENHPRDVGHTRSSRPEFLFKSVMSWYLKLLLQTQMPSLVQGQLLQLKLPRT